MTSEADRNNKAVELGTLVLLGLGGVLGAGGFNETMSGPRRELFFGSYVSLMLAVLVFVAYYGLHPLFGALNTWRVGVLVGLRERMAGHRMRAAALSAVPSTPTADPATSDGAGALVINKATYRPVDHSVQVTADATDIARGRIVDGRLDMTVSNDALGGDPAPNCPKELVIDWRRDGGPPHTTIVNEGNAFTL